MGPRVDPARIARRAAGLGNARCADPASDPFLIALSPEPAARPLHELIIETFEPALSYAHEHNAERIKLP